MEVLNNMICEIHSQEKAAANKINKVMSQVEIPTEETGMEMDKGDKIQQSGMHMGI